MVLKFFQFTSLSIKISSDTQIRTQTYLTVTVRLERYCTKYALYVQVHVIYVQVLHKVRN